MYKIKLSIEGIIKEIMINANDTFSAQQAIINMYGTGKVQIIDIRRI